MGTVYLGRHPAQGTFAAVKLLPHSMAHQAGFVARFNREIEAMKQMKNPHIVELYESGESQDSYYYAMEYVQGETLADRLEREGKIPWREVIEIAVQICSALKSAHNAGIIHRDLKPSNLLLRSDGVVKLADFGVAQVFATGKLTVTGGVLGTAEYMSPEQAQGKRATKQSDIYSLGAVMYVMLTGRPPFTGNSALDVMQKHRFSQFDSVKRLVPDVPFWLDEIVCQALSKKVEDRFPDAYVLSLRLQEVPKKVDLRLQQAAEQAELRGDDETLADTDLARDLRGEFGGTLVRDLFRAQMDAEKSTTNWQQHLDNVWVLVGLLVFLGGAVYVLSLLNTPSQQAIFARGVALMERPEGPAWETAKREYFDPLVQRDASRWKAAVQPYLEQIEVYELEKKLQGRKLKPEEVPQSEQQAILRRVMELRKVGRASEALSLLTALRALTAPHDQILIRLLDQSIAETAADMNDARLDYVRESLARADELFEKGDVEQAVSIWFSVKKLYDQHPPAAELVEQAVKRYLDATGVQL